MPSPANTAIGECDEAFSALHERLSRPALAAGAAAFSDNLVAFLHDRPWRRRVERPGARSVLIIFDGLAAQP
jgi:hypothetical protein